MLSHDAELEPPAAAERRRTGARRLRVRRRRPVSLLERDPCVKLRIVSLVRRHDDEACGERPCQRWRCPVFGEIDRHLDQGEIRIARPSGEPGLIARIPQLFGFPLIDDTWAVPESAT